MIVEQLVQKRRRVFAHTEGRDRARGAEEPSRLWSLEELSDYMNKRVKILDGKGSISATWGERGQGAG